MNSKGVVEHNPVFACLTENQLDQLLDQALKRHYHTGQYLALAGDIWPYLFILLDGSISAVKESLEGRSLIATSLMPGEVFWGVTFFHPELPMPVALRVDRPSSILLWSREQALPVLSANGLMSWELSRLMVNKMLRASEIVEELAFQPVVGRLARLLMDYPGQSASGPIARSLTLDDMASRIGTTREVVCRFLQRFAEDELINITRTEFEITDRERLLVIANKVRG
jgi:CRP/FNR family cyclic AMP-dependent transcriptional regulator